MIWDRSFSYRMALESVIPKKMIAIMSKYCGMDLEQNEEYIPILLKRLNSCSGYPITYKLRNASATDEWFMYYTHNVIMTFTDLELESGNKKNMTDDYYNITFRVTAEFNLPGVYMIDGNIDQLNAIDITLRTKEYQEENDSYFPLYSVNNLYSRFPAEMNGMQLYGTTIFQTTAEKGQLEDRINITSVLDNDHIRVIQAHNTWNMEPSTLLNAYVLKDGELLQSEKDYHIDWNTLDIVVTNIDNTSTYRLILYFNYDTVNEILNNTAYDRNFDINTLKENKFPDTGLASGETNIYDSVSDTKIHNDSIYDESNIPEDDTDYSDNVILEPDPTYDADDHVIEDPDLILYNNRVILNSDDNRTKQVSSEIFLEGHVDENVEEPTILEDDPTYDANEDHGVDINSISIAALDDATTADIHNSSVSTKKRFSSSI